MKIIKFKQEFLESIRDGSKTQTMRMPSSRIDVHENDIVIALEKYEGTGLRQNFCNIGGYQLYVDCYNSAPNSIVGSVETLLRIPIAENNKRIVVFGDIPRLGKDAEKIHKECGEILKKFNIDLYLFFGRNAKYRNTGQGIGMSFLLAYGWRTTD